MCDSEEEYEPERKRGKANKDLQCKEKEKLARQKGKEFVSCKGLLVEAKTTGPDCNCHKKCMGNFSVEEKGSIIDNIYNGRPKNEKDTFLMGLIERYDVARHRPLTKNSKQNLSSFKYFAIKGTSRVEVCRNAYISLHAISSKVVQRLTKLVATNQSPVDVRGKSQNRGNTLDAHIVIKIDDHISSFPKKESHYSSLPVTYLDSSLTVSKMHGLFIKKHPDLKGVIKYEYYLKHFNDNYGYRFGRPQVDVCSTCEDLNTKIKSSTLNDVAKRAAVAELLVHKRRAKKFYSKMENVKNICKERNDVMAIAFDFMQNMPLPFIPVQEMFYLQGEALRGPNEVCSCLLDFINQISEEVKILYVFSDACAGQNRNHTLTRLLATLTMNGRFSVIHQFYPIRGHSFLPCDRTFSVIKRQVRRLDRIYSPNQYDDIIRNARKLNPPYEVKRLLNNQVLNFKGWWPQYFKKTCKDIENKNLTFNIKDERLCRGCVEASEYIDGLHHGTFRLKKQDYVELPTTAAYTGKLDINIKKIQDISKVTHYIPDEYKSFYEDILKYPTSNTADSDKDE
ncbi:hypothetical protein L9F63_015095 [Diploptera punctata]|uniref:DUF7869 domain-containing protein n=1 Tax=Diploptera punctata TaxID=6984 RepID=A0AAD8A6J3_DIPPU|nr:hypothetical protein L9F63_015095 [Diploptera punctata]